MSIPFPPMFDIPALLKEHNTRVDRFFYDVGKLTDSEREQLESRSEEEGYIIVVPPCNSNAKLEIFGSVDAFCQTRGESIQAIALAGVGSSALGTAALARNVANAIGHPVAGIVTGQGGADLMKEAMGGWYFYGMLDAGEDYLRSLPGRFGLGDTWFKNIDSRAHRNLGKASFKDVDTLRTLLTKPLPKLKLLVGHSKGCLMIDHVLEELQGSTMEAQSPLNQLCIVTLSTVVDLPECYTKVFQFRGADDLLGAANSRGNRTFISIPNAKHHTNTCIDQFLSVEKVFRDFLIGKVCL